MGQGSPLNAIEQIEFILSSEALGRTTPRPRAVLCVSAHWKTRGTRLTAMETPRNTHNFYRFPLVLSEKQYPVPGSPELVEKYRAR